MIPYARNVALKKPKIGQPRSQWFLRSESPSTSAARPAPHVRTHIVIGRRPSRDTPADSNVTAYFHARHATTIQRRRSCADGFPVSLSVTGKGVQERARRV